MMKDMVDAGLLLNVDDYFADSESVTKKILMMEHLITILQEMEMLTVFRLNPQEVFSWQTKLF
ncbi:MAG: hypothetical protein ACLUTU_14215 [Blautia faecis]